MCTNKLSCSAFRVQTCWIWKLIARCVLQPTNINSNQIQMAFVELTQWHRFFEFENSSVTKTTAKLCHWKILWIYSVHTLLMCAPYVCDGMGTASNYLEQYQRDDMSAKFKVKRLSSNGGKKLPVICWLKSAAQQLKSLNCGKLPTLDAGRFPFLSPSPCFFETHFAQCPQSVRHSGGQKRSSNNKSTACSSSPSLPIASSCRVNCVVATVAVWAAHWGTNLIHLP